MDYARIYSEFIADRRLKEPALTGYTEKHHILPRCMGGDDSEENLIALTAEDHFFAHLVLAKAHESGQTWGAVRLMAGHVLQLAKAERKGLPRAEAIMSRRLYGAAKRWANTRLSGTGHPMADAEVYHFVHEDGREYRGTRFEFGDKHGVPQASVNSIVTASAMSAYGWYLPALNPEGRVGMEAEAQMDKLKRPYVHFDGREVVADRREMAEITGLTVGNIGMLITGRTKSAAGWQINDGRPLVSADYLRTDGEHNARFDATEYTFVHDDGRVMVATMNEAARRYGARATWTSVAQGKKTFKGWRLQGTEHRRSTKGKPRRYINRDGRVFEGTQSEFGKMAGLTAGPIHAVTHRASITLCGWRIESTQDRPLNWRKDGSGPARTGSVYELRRGKEVIKGDRHHIAAMLGASPEAVSAAVYALKAGKMPRYKGYSLTG